jgi:hypothetical protein
MSAYGIAIGVMLVGLLFAATVARASGVIPDDPAVLAKTTPLGKILTTVRDRPVHVVFVHGMRADGTGASKTFRAGLCRYVPGICASADAPERKFLPLGPRPNAAYLGTPVWRTDAEWTASTPFVDRYVIARTGGEPIIVDEVNWWPLLFPPKCRFIVVPEVNLSGADRQHLKLCANSQAPYYPWLNDRELQDALERKPTSGGGSLLNRSLKQQIMNWGLTDAVLALGPLREYFRKAVNEAFDYASHYDKRDLNDQEFIVISESLGSFVVLDAFNDLYGDSPAAKRVGERTADLYFFANQFALLELGRIDIKSSSGGVRSLSDAGKPQQASPAYLLEGWARSGNRADFIGHPKQVIAFSDPSDFLTFQVPKIRDPITGQDLALVVNVYDRNEFGWFGLFSWPATAHTGHSANPAVLKLIFRTQ